MPSNRAPLSACMLLNRATLIATARAASRRVPLTDRFSTGGRAQLSTGHPRATLETSLDLLRRNKEMTSLRFLQVQAFSDKPFAGNPAAVFLIPPAADGATHESGWSIQDIVMQKIAAEMRLSETAFVTPADDAGCFSTSQRFLLRWFTPTKEVDLCGHATLASAAALAVECDNDTECFEFETRSGILTAARHRTTGLVRGSSGAFELNLPANPPVTSPTAGPDAEAHRAIARMAVGKDHAPAITELAYSATTKKLLVRMNPASFGRADLEALAVPPADSLLAIPQTGACPVTGVMVTVESQQPAYDFISRYFAPWNGIPEDPVDYVCFFAYSRAPDSHAPSHKRLSPPLAR